MIRNMRTPRPKQLGVYAGSFDPLTVGHLWMIEQGGRLFDRLDVAIGINPDKKYTFPLEERLEMLRAVHPPVSQPRRLVFLKPLSHRLRQQISATHIFRGIRSESDYEFERTMRNINGDLEPGICTVFLDAAPQHCRGQFQHGQGIGGAGRVEEGGAKLCARPGL